MEAYNVTKYVPCQSSVGPWAHAVRAVGLGLGEVGPVSHVRVDVHPDGGLNRLKLFGCIVQ